MPQLTKVLLVLMSLVVLSANVACSKKSSKRGGGGPPPSASGNPQAGGQQGGDPQADGGQADGLDGDEELPPPGAPEDQDTTTPVVLDERYGVSDTAQREDSMLASSTEITTVGDGLDEIMTHPDVTGWDQGPSRNRECGTAYRRSSQQWFPGLPYPPSETRICTGGKVGEVSQDEVFRCEPGSGYIFTDGRQDALMALAVERFNQIPAEYQNGSRELAENIRDLKVSADIYQTGNVKVQFAIMTGPEQYETFQLSGRMSNWRGRTRTDVRLGRVTNAGLTFSAVLTCADLQIGCQNSIVRIQQHGQTGRIRRAAYVVHRWGDAHVTISDKDLNHYNQIENSNYREFARFLSNTANNSCLTILGAVQTGTRQMPECAQRRLLAQCGRKQWQQPAAKIFDFRSWAVAYGRSGFEFAMIDQNGLYDFESQSEPRLRIRGPLITSNQLPVWSRPLRVDGTHSAGIENVALVSNDGGGNLNLQVDFKGATKSFTRVSITTLIEDTRFNADQMVQDASQMPALETSQLEVEMPVAPPAPPAPSEDELPPPPAPPVEPPVEQHVPEADMG